MKKPKEQKMDFRQQINKALKIYYNTTGTIVLEEKAVENYDILADRNLFSAIAETVEQDGHVSYLRGYSRLPVGRMTAQGRVFFEQGGYKDSKSRVDKMIFWSRDHKVFSWVIFIAIAFTSIRVHQNHYGSD